MIDLVLLNSLGTTSAMWDRTAAALAGGPFSVVTTELPGHAHGDIAPFTFEDAVSRVAADLDSRGVAGALAAGVSMGGSIAVALAAARPDLVAGVVAINAPVAQPSREFWVERAAAVRADGMSSVADGLRERWFGGGDGSGVIQALAAMEPEGYANACLALADLDIRDAAARVAAPTLVVRADDDPSVDRSNARALARAIPDAVLWPVRTGGHLLPVTRPALVARLILTFSESALAAAPTEGER